MKNTNAVLFIAILALGVILVPGLATAQNSQVATVNLQLIMDSHPGLEEAQLRLDQEVDRLLGELEVLDEAQQQQMLPQLQEQLQLLEFQIQTELLEDIQAVIAQVAETLDISTVLDRGVVLYGGIDISEDVINALQELE